MEIVKPLIFLLVCFCAQAFADEQPKTDLDQAIRSGELDYNTTRTLPHYEQVFGYDTENPLGFRKSERRSANLSAGWMWEREVVRLVLII